MRSAVLLFQIAILVLSGAAVSLQVWNFPFPSPLAHPFLGPKERWPEDQIKQWVESGVFEPAFVQFFMRDPDRTAPPGNNLVSPADGVVKEIVETANNHYYVVGLSFWDVHVVRTPVAGIVKDVVEEGEVVFRDRSETEQMVFLREKASPVQKVVVVQADDGSEYRIRLITSWWASRLKVSARVGQKLEKGERIGRILLGSSVVIDAPTSHKFSTPVGSRVVAGETVICRK